MIIAALHEHLNHIFIHLGKYNIRLHTIKFGEEISGYIAIYMGEYIANFSTPIAHIDFAHDRFIVSMPNHYLEIDYNDPKSISLITKLVGDLFQDMYIMQQQIVQ